MINEWQEKKLLYQTHNHGHSRERCWTQDLYPHTIPFPLGCSIQNTFLFYFLQKHLYKCNLVWMASLFLVYRISFRGLIFCKSLFSWKGCWEELPIFSWMLKKSLTPILNYILASILIVSSFWCQTCSRFKFLIAIQYFNLLNVPDRNYGGF